MRQEVEKGSPALRGAVFGSGALLRRKKRGGLYPLDGALRRRLEAPQAFEVVAEELGADGELLARTPRVDDSAADRIVPRLLNRRHAAVAHLGELRAHVDEAHLVRPERKRGDGPFRNWRGERRERRHDDAGIRREAPCLDGRDSLQPHAERVPVSVEKGRELEYAHGEWSLALRSGRGVRREDAKVVREPVGVGKPWRYREDEFRVARESEREERVR